MNDADIGYLFDMLEQMTTRLIRTESKLSALMNHLKLSPQGEPIEPAYSKHRPNSGTRTEGAFKSGANQRR